MAAYALPVVFTLVAWWASTGLILVLVRLPRWTFVATMLGATVLLGLGLMGLDATATDATPAGAYLAFSSALAVWAWLETSFLLGYVTGPRQEGCPAGCSQAHFRHSVEAVIYHEVAILIGVGLVLFITRGAANQVGTTTFIALWLMRLSAKLNLYLGVANRGEQFLPAHLAYLKSFFGRRRGNALLPVSLVCMGLAAAWFIGKAQGGSTFEVTGALLLATLVLLGLLEHGFMVLPLPSERLWQWRTKPAPHPRGNQGLPPDLKVALPLGTLKPLACHADHHKKPASTLRRTHPAGDSHD